VGGIILGVKDSKILTPRGNKFGVLNFLNTLAQEQEITTSNIEVALKSLRPLVKSSSIICLISDFEHFSEEAQKQCEQLAKYNDLLFVHVSDPLEKNPPAAGQYLVTDGDQELLLDTEDLAFCLEYQEKFKARIKSIQDFCQRTGIDFYAVDTADDLKSVWAK
jgi:uncharacterized protein (DUF58 family)